MQLVELPRRPNPLREAGGLAGAVLWDWHGQQTVLVHDPQEELTVSTAGARCLPEIGCRLAESREPHGRLRPRVVRVRVLHEHLAEQPPGIPVSRASCCT